MGVVPTEYTNKCKTRKRNYLGVERDVSYQMKKVKNKNKTDFQENFRVCVAVVVVRVISIS